MSRTLRALRGAVIALAMTAPLAFLPARECASATPAPLRFAGVAWGAREPQVTKAYAKQGWVLRLGRDDGGTRYVGRVWDRSADIEPEYDAAGALAAVTLKFHPESEGDALQLYGALVERMRLAHGPWAEQIAPARPISREWEGRERRLIAREELTAATLWVSPAEDAAAVQLDAAHYVWVRYESRAWAAAHADTSAAAAH